jgi:hypothetical protein
MPINAATGASCTINLLPPPPPPTTSSSTDQIPARIPCEEYNHETTTHPTTGAIQETVTIESQQQACQFEILIDINPTAYSTLTAANSSSTPCTPQDYIIHPILDGVSAGYLRRPKTNSGGLVRLKSPPFF